MLWLALRFPRLPVESLPPSPLPSAVVVRGRVLVGDGAAAAAGVAPGQALSTALGLLPALQARERDAAGERRALEGLACWAGRFTPLVCLPAGDELLLEIGGCLRLFGGAGAIAAAVAEGCAGQGYSHAWAVAPTPLGARWLARAKAGTLCQEAAALPALLDDLPCRAAGWPEAVASRLEAFGVTRLGGLRRLPTAALRRRLGSTAVDDWLRAQGLLPDPQTGFVFPERFALRLELPSRIEQAEGLLFVGRRLFAALTGWLRARQWLLRRCTLRLEHDEGPESTLSLRFSEAAADDDRFLRLLREHLGGLALRAPVEAVALTADECCPRSGASGHLFEQAAPGEGRAACLERLRARLGEENVRCLAEVADYRPECASREQAADDEAPPAAGGTVAPRPLWLLPQPLALAERDGRPHWHGALRLLSRAERLESGWWDEGEAGRTGDIRRDYFVARNPQGQWAWVFRDAAGWFLHGLFA